MLRRSVHFLFTICLLAAAQINLPQAGAQNSPNEEPKKVWIFLRDKGPQALSKNSAAYRQAAENLSPRALARRAKVLPPNALVEITDLEIYKPYLEELGRLGLEPIVHSRWLNAISAMVSLEQMQALQELPFVSSVQTVAHLRVPPVSPAAPPPLLKTNGPHRFAYGASLAQMEQIGAANLHDAGIFGRGVLVGMMDSGFRWQDHDAFDSLTVVKERDFVKNDDLTRYETGDPDGQDEHGTETLSTLAGFKPGELIGPAFGAQFLLAKTENIASETHAEEDFWVAAIEWMEMQGVEVTSTSLGYSTFDAGQVSYTPAQMDGKTAIITQAAETAASKGVIVVNSAGNEGDDPNWGIITAPADGPNVIAVGAVSANGGIIGFSSRGPTADGRIKPDVMAMGSGVRVVVIGSISNYTFSSGTSFSCPLVAGVVAQILSAHPEVTPQQMLNALRNTASRAQSPDNDFGYGIVNARAAVTAFGPAFSNVPEVNNSQSGVLGITVHILSRDGLDPNSVRVHYAERNSNNFATAALVQVDSISYSGQIPKPTTDTAYVKVYFTATDNSFGNVAYPKDAPQNSLLIRTDVSTGPNPTPTTFALQQNLPNPFRISEAQATNITFALATQAQVRLRVFNVLGQQVRELINTTRPAGRYTMQWNGRDDRGGLVSSGVYFYVLDTPQQTLMKKLLFLR